MTTTGVQETAPLIRGRMTGRAPASGIRTAPGVSVEWVGPLFRGLDALRSDVAAFVGLAARGPTDHAKRLASATEFDSLYGPPSDGMLLAPAVHGFFANGGTTCWVVRAVHRDTARFAEAALELDNRVRFRARSEGTWGNEMRIDIQPAGVDRVTVTVTAKDGRREFWRNLDVDGLRSHFDEDGTSERSASALISMTLPEGTQLPDAAVGVQLAGGVDGLAELTPAHLVGDQSVIAAGKPHGVGLLADVDEIAQVGVPDLVLREPGNVLGLPAFGPTDIESAHAQLIGGCQVLQRTALLHHPNPNALIDEAIRWRGGFNNSYAALYWPWLRTHDPLRPDGLQAVPPCGHVAGIVARSDLAAGPHKPPANEVVRGAVGLTLPVDDDAHGRANDAGVNVVRAVSGRGIRVLGARTMNIEPQWRYLNVRRLVTQIERSVAAYAGWLVFEPDNQPLRDDVERVVRQLLDEIWRSGGLEGATADEAYTVHIEQAQAALAVAEGRLVVEIGLQPPWPAEFVVVRIDLSQLDTGDRTRGGGAHGDDR